MQRYTRADVERSYHQGHHGDPMVNVKVHTFPLIESGFRQFMKDNADVEPEFTLDWIEENTTEDYLDSLFWTMCEWRWEDLQSDAEDIFAGPQEARPGDRVKVHAAGRSGGYAVVQGLGDVDEWDAVMLAKWRKFAKFARATADYIPADIVGSLYLNDFLGSLEEAAERERAANMDVATRG